MDEMVIGRERELAALDQALDTLESGPIALLVEGEPGVGKTSVWRRGVRVAGQRGWRVLAARPVEVEAALPYTALADLFQGTLDVAAGLPPPQQRALEIALLVTDADGDGPDPRAIGLAILGVLRRLAADAPLVVAIDDVQWTDEDSRRVLSFALRRMVDEPVAALLTRRTGPAVGMPLGLDAVLPGARLHRFGLRGLDEGDLYRLLVDRLGIRLPRPALVRLHRTTNGNPMFSLEIGRSLRGRGGEVDLGGRWPVPGTLQATLEERLAALSVPARTALLVTAALAQPSRQLLEAATSAAAPALREAVAAGVVVLAGERIGFTHPLFGSVLYENASRAERRAIHRRLADLIADPIEQAVHLALGAEGPDASIARTLAAAARRAAGRGAPDAALELAEHARRLAPPGLGVDLSALALDASDFAFAAGDTARARGLLEELLRHSAGRPRVEARLRLAMLATYDGSVRVARELSQQALAEGVDDPCITATIHRRLALAHLLLLEAGPAERHGQAAVAAAEQAADPAMLARALASLAHLRALHGGADAEPLLARALALEDAPGVASIDDSPTAIAGMLRMYAGELSNARCLLQASLERARSRGGDPLGTGLCFALSELESRAGRFDEAARLAQYGLDACEQSGQATERAVLLYTKGLANAHLGLVDAARDSVGAGLEIAVAAEHRVAVVQHQWVLGLLELSLGRPDAAWAALEPAVAVQRAFGLHQLGTVPIHPEAVEAALALGRIDDARTLVAELEGAAPGPWRDALAPHARGVLCAAEGDIEGALISLDHAVSQHPRLGSRFALGRTLLVLGATQRRAKRKRAAREALDAAITCFTETGATLWAQRGREERARIGGRSPAGDQLTPTERQVARLVADGHTNREVAASLFISVKTVDANLQRIYRKLSVRSRTQLSRALNPHEPTPGHTDDDPSADQGGAAARS